MLGSRTVGGRRYGEDRFSDLDATEVCLGTTTLHLRDYTLSRRIGPSRIRMADQDKSRTLAGFLIGATRDRRPSDDTTKTASIAGLTLVRFDDD